MRDWTTGWVMCVYCGGPPETDDHVPAKVFLDDPLPLNLPVVKACLACNQGASSDEEYFACFLDCVVSGSFEPKWVRRKKIKGALTKHPNLVEQLRSSLRGDADGQLLWTPDATRIQKVIVKLARGHTAFELSRAQHEEPQRVSYCPIPTMTERDREDFERAGSGELRGWPEIGSRAFLRAAGVRPYSDQRGPWIEVQPIQYRYSVDELGGVLVRIVLAEYLACIVEWE